MTVTATLKHPHRNLPAGLLLEVSIPADIDELHPHSLVECKGCPALCKETLRLRIDAFAEADAIRFCVEQGVSFKVAQRAVRIRKSAALRKKGVPLHH